MQKAAKIIRIITIAPLMALMLLITLFITRREIFGNTADFICAIIFLTILPTLSYPMQRFLPHFKDGGRNAQRTLAMIFAVSGYVLGCIVTLFLKAPDGMWVIYLEYLASGLLIFLFNKLFHLKASGHACGVIGPSALLLYFGVKYSWIFCILIITATFWASLKMKRHTVYQLIGGTLIPIAVLLVLSLVF